MRMIAEHAGVALGNAYYYFASKEHLVQGLYEQLEAEQMQASEPVLAREKSFKNRLAGAILAELTVLEPHHRLCATLFKHAADPASPLSPFGSASESIRNRVIAFYARLVEGSQDTIPRDLKDDLPRLLWLFKMGIVLFWIHDRTFGRNRTYHLVSRSVDIIATLVSLMSMPILVPVRKQLLALIQGLKDPPF